MLKPIFQEWDCNSQPIFLRADLNVSIANNTITNTFRLEALKPTLNYLLNKNAIIVLGTHIGRPKNNDNNLSTKQLIPWFKKEGYSISFCATLDEAQTHIKKAQPKTIILLENLRFFKAEQSSQNLTYIKQLSELASFYVTDAFGVLHRDDSSVSLLPKQFPFEKRSIGFLVEKELKTISKIKKKSPLVLIMGGCKTKTKIPLIEPLTSVVDTFVITPALCFTFLKSQNKAVGKSLFDPNLIEACKSIEKNIKKQNKKIILPTDFQVAEDTLDGALSYTQTIRSNQIGISLGPQSLEKVKTICDSAQGIIFNGAIGFENRKETLSAMKSIFTYMEHASANSLIAGQDSVAAYTRLGSGTIDSLITGGGSALYYLAHDYLPGLEPFIKK